EALGGEDGPRGDGSHREDGKSERETGGSEVLEEQALTGERERKTQATEDRDGCAQGHLASRRAALDRLRDIPDRAHDVQLGHPPGSNRDGRHGDEEPDGESVDQVRVRPREDERGATERTGAEDLRGSPDDYGRDERSQQGADEGRQQPVVA